MHLASLISVVIAVLGAAATLAWMPGRPASAGARRRRAAGRARAGGPAAGTEG